MASKNTDATVRQVMNEVRLCHRLSTPHLLQSKPMHILSHAPAVRAVCYDTLELDVKVFVFKHNNRVRLKDLCRAFKNEIAHSDLIDIISRIAYATQQNGTIFAVLKESAIASLPHNGYEDVD